MYRRLASFVGSILVFPQNIHGFNIINNHLFLYWIFLRINSSVSLSFIIYNIDIFLSIVPLWTYADLSYVRRGYFILSNIIKFNGTLNSSHYCIFIRAQKLDVHFTAVFFFYYLIIFYIYNFLVFSFISLFRIVGIRRTGYSMTLRLSSFHIFGYFFCSSTILSLQLFFFFLISLPIMILTI